LSYPQEVLFFFWSSQDTTTTIGVFGAKQTESRNKATGKKMRALGKNLTSQLLELPVAAFDDQILGITFLAWFVRTIQLSHG